MRRSSYINVDVTAELKDALSEQLHVFRPDVIEQRENVAPLQSRRSWRVAQAGSKKDLYFLRATRAPHDRNPFNCWQESKSLNRGDRCIASISVSLFGEEYPLLSLPRSTKRIEAAPVRQLHRLARTSTPCGGRHRRRRARKLIRRFLLCFRRLAVRVIRSHRGEEARVSFFGLTPRLNRPEGNNRIRAPLARTPALSANLAMSDRSSARITAR